MRGGALPPALVCLALAFALSFAPRNALTLGIPVLWGLAIVVSRIAFDSAQDDFVFLGCWATIASTAGAVHLRGGVSRWLAVGLAANAGLWSGAVVSAAGSPIDLITSLPLALLSYPGALLARTRGAIGIKVVASWLVAVSILAAALSASPITPGYEPDHLE